jgi:transcriptional regulator with GAF, ATPase, and Fis domain
MLNNIVSRVLIPDNKMASHEERLKTRLELLAAEQEFTRQRIEALKSKLDEEKLYLEEDIRDERYFEDIIGNSSVLRCVLQEVETVAPADSTVLIIGETGTGTENEH